VSFATFEACVRNLEIRFALIDRAHVGGIGKLWSSDRGFRFDSWCPLTYTFNIKIFEPRLMAFGTCEHPLLAPSSASPVNALVRFII
jgi:hypothetical protein